MTADQQAFVLRIAPSGIDRMREALADGHAIIGWAHAAELLDSALDWERFRGILRSYYYAEDKNFRRAGAAAGHMWRFIREMKPGDLIVAPHGSGFYVGQITGDVTHDPAKVEDDTAFRRKVEWLNGKQPIPRSLARAALQSRMKTQGTCAYASDLIDDIKECLELSARKESRTFDTDLRERLIREALDEVQSGRLDSYKFEELVKALLLSLGAEEAHVVLPRSRDKGADILATFMVAGTFRLLVAVQAKHWQPDPPVGRDVVEQLVRGLEAEGANLGMVVTCGSISEEAVAFADAYFEDKGVKIELVDGPYLASLIVERGLRERPGTSLTE